MNLNVDPEWLRQMAEKEDGGIVSVGGLFVEPQNYPITAADLQAILPEVLAPFVARIEALEVRLAQLEGEGSLGLGGK